MQKKEMAEKEILGKWSSKIKSIKLKKKLLNGKKWLFYKENNNYNKQRKEKE